MKIFEKELRYRNGELVEVNRGWGDRLKFCVTGLRQFFSIPTKAQIIHSGNHYFIAVYDRKIKEALKVRVHPSQPDQIQPERGEGWANISFNMDVEDKMISLFNQSGKKFLYVRMEEA